MQKANDSTQTLFFMNLGLIAGVLAGDAVFVYVAIIVIALVGCLVQAITGSKWNTLMFFLMGLFGAIQLIRMAF